MPRPANITEEDLQEWEASRLEYEKERGDPGPMLLTMALIPSWKPCDPKELFYSGEWLGREIRAIGLARPLGYCPRSKNRSVG
jgi:hypothetical protein